MGDILVDARWLEPPEPLQQVLVVLGRRNRGQRVRLLLHREPFPLYTLLGQMGLAYEVRALSDGCFEILIYDRADGSARGNRAQQRA